MLGVELDCNSKGINGYNITDVNEFGLDNYRPAIQF